MVVGEELGSLLGVALGATLGMELGLLDKSFEWERERWEGKAVIWKSEVSDLLPHFSPQALLHGPVFSDIPLRLCQ